jgi:DNA uptake protein ComE-like DNA-binding protein
MARKSSLLHLLNVLSMDDLVRLHGVSANLAEQIVSHRPYISEQEVLERAVIPKRAFERIVKELRADGSIQ